MHDRLRAADVFLRHLLPESRDDGRNKYNGHFFSSFRPCNLYHQKTSQPTECEQHHGERERKKIRHNRKGDEQMAWFSFLFAHCFASDSASLAATRLAKVRGKRKKVEEKKKDNKVYRESEGRKKKLGREKKRIEKRESN